MAGTYGIEVEKRIKALRKKIAQIEKLKAKGGEYSPEEATKIASEPKILADIAALERGEDPTPHIEEEAKPAAAAEAVEAVPEVVQEVQEEKGPTEELPEEPPEKTEPAPELSPVEAEKRIRALKKKLGQISKLKEKGGTYTKEETEKIASEPSMSAEVLDLEIGLLEPEHKKNALSLKVKLDQISKLRAKGAPLTLQEKEKTRKEDAIRKELNDILAGRVPVEIPKTKKEEEAPPKKVKESAPKVQEVAPAMPAEPEYVEYAVQVEEEPHALESDESLAFAQGFATEEPFEDEGFIEATKRHKKKAPKEVPPEPTPAPTPVVATTPAPAPAPAPTPVVQEQEAPDPVEEVAEAADDSHDWSPPPVEETPCTVAAAEEVATGPKAPPEAPLPAEEAPDTEPSGPPSTEKRIRNLKKKLVQIEKLKSRGGDYTVEEKEKLASQQKIEEEIAALENGEPWPPVGAEPVPEPAPVEEVQEEAPAPVEEEVVPEEPPVPDLTPEEAAKKIKALKKKLAQIGKLKERESQSLSPEEAGKVASEPKLLKEIAVLEGLLA